MRKRTTEKKRLQSLIVSLVLWLLILPQGQFAATQIPPTTLDAALANASTKNQQLKFSMPWIFGGKPQQGWYLYEALIAQLIGYQGRSDERGFAQALMRWQQQQRLPATGILTEESWMRMISLWQNQRSADRSVSPPEKLLTVSAAEFYDPTRPAELRSVERDAYVAYKKMLAAASKDLSLRMDAQGNLIEPFLKIISAFRSPAYQQTLRTQAPQAGRAALAVNSPHFTGRALDLYVGGEPVSTKDANRALQIMTPSYQWLVKNAHRFGFTPYFYEPWHWEFNPAH